MPLAETVRRALPALLKLVLVDAYCCRSVAMPDENEDDSDWEEDGATSRGAKVLPDENEDGLLMVEKPLNLSVIRLLTRVAPNVTWRCRARLKWRMEVEPSMFQSLPAGWVREVGWLIYTRTGTHRLGGLGSRYWPPA